MNDVYQKLSHAVKLWQIQEAPNARSDIEVTEAWYSHETDHVSVQNNYIRSDQLATWLHQTAKASNSGVKTLIMRLIWVKVDSDPEKRHLNISKSTLQTLLKAFGLRLAFEYFQSLVTGVVKLPAEETVHGQRQAYAFSYAPKLAAVWSSSYRPPPFRCSSLTQGLIFVRESSQSPGSQPEGSVIQMLRESLASTWDTGMLCHPVFPAYLIALLLGVQIDHTQQDIKKKVQGLESRTGYHDFATRQEEAATGLKQTLSAKASGWATKLASVERKSKTIEQLLTLISKETSTQMARAADLERNDLPEIPERNACNTVKRETAMLLSSQADVLRYRHDMQVLDTQYITKRVEIQIQALFHMIAQDDAFSNYKLSHHMSQTAEFSYRDAASMKTLAVVTMFFLPGSFVSALFSTELFAWDSVDELSKSIGIATTPQMQLYWAVTIPLTLATFVLYFLWLWYQKRERKKNFMSDEEMNEVAAKNEGLESATRKQTFISERTRISHKL